MGKEPSKELIRFWINEKIKYLLFLCVNCHDDLDRSRFGIDYANPIFGREETSLIDNRIDNTAPFDSGRRLYGEYDIFFDNEGSKMRLLLGNENGPIYQKLGDETTRDIKADELNIDEFLKGGPFVFILHNYPTPDTTDYQMMQKVIFNDCQYLIKVLERSLTFKTNHFSTFAASMNQTILCLAKFLFVSSGVYYENDKTLYDINHFSEERAIFCSPIRHFHPLMVEGAKRVKQLHAPKAKKNKLVLTHCQALMRAKPAPSAARLMKRFPYGESKAIDIDGVSFYRENTENGHTVIYCIFPNGKRKTIGERAFQGYFKEAKKS